METNERVLKFIEYKGINVSTFEKSIGKSTNYVRNSKSFTSNVLAEIMNTYPELNISWLITGNGEMIKTVASVPIAIISKEHKKDSIPYYDDLPVSAGQHDLSLFSNGETPSGWINIPGVSAEGLFPVIGCSMKPEINPGDVVGLAAVSRWDIVDPDKIYMIVTNDDRMIKHLATDDDDREILWCISPNYNKFSIRKEEIKFIYRVTFHGRMV